MRISGKQLATGMAVALACALGAFSLAGCGGAESPIHDEIEVAKADIASDVPSEIIEGWSFLAQNKDDSEAKRAIEELGGIPTPYANLYQLWRMAGTGKMTLRQADDLDREEEIEEYFQNALGISMTESTGEYGVCKVPCLSASNEYVKSATDEIFGKEVITQINANNWYYLDRDDYPTNLELQVQDVPEISSESEAVAILDKITDYAGLGQKTSQGGSDAGLWYTCGKKDGATWYAIYHWETSSVGDHPMINVWVSDCFASNAESALKNYDRSEDFELYDALLSGRQESEKASSSGSSSNSLSQSVLKDEKITEIDGKTVWKVQATSSSIHFLGSFTGSGNFIVKLLDSNQDLVSLVCNEIGDHKLDKSISTSVGSTYYIQIECSSGTWNVSWSGTGGA